MGGLLDPDAHRQEVLANIIAPPLKHWSWAIEWKDRVGFLGMCVLRPLEGTDFICIGWRLMPQHWGQGIATEAAQAVLVHASQTLKIEPVVALIDPGNLPSIRVAQKIGLRELGTAYHYGTQQVFFRAVPRSARV